MEEFIGFFVGYMVFLLVVWLLTTAYSIASYVMGSLGFYTIAKRRGIDKPWLAWIPVLNVWTIGCISDQYQYVVKGENKSKRKILLGLQIAAILCVILFYVVYFVFFIRTFASMEYMDDMSMVSSVFSTFGLMLLIMIPMSIISILASIFTYMALFDVFTSCSPKNNVLFLLLSIFLGIHPFIVFFIRKKEDGMPPRREPVSCIPQQVNWQPPVENRQPQQPTMENWQPQQPESL